MTSVRSQPLARETSLYIDAMRFLAAVVVFLGHFAYPSISGGLFWQAGPFGGDAVIVFFIISGFVIAHATARRETSLEVYAVNRAARIYSVAIPAIALTLLCDLGERTFDPHFADWSQSIAPAWQQLVASVTFTNQFWGLDYYPGDNGAYWSLGYEVPYYAIFGAFIFARGYRRLVLPAALLIAAGPWIAILFPIWLMGVVIYRLGRSWRLPEGLGWTAFVGSILVWILAQCWLPLYFPAPVHFAQLNFGYDYVTAVCFAINLIGFEAIAHRFSAVLLPGQKAIHWLAGRTFTFYVIHMPILKLCASLPIWHKTDTVMRVSTMAIVLLAVLAVGHCFEERREPWRRFFAALWPSASPAAAPRAARS